MPLPPIGWMPRAVLASLALLVWSGAVRAADSAADFFTGKVITITVGVAPGGGYDLYARLVAEHLGRHIPGRPNITVVNMPGGGGLRARDLAGGVDASRAPHASFHSPPDPFPFHPTHEVLESFGYFSLSITAADYLTQEFGVSDLEAREPLPSVAPSAAPPLWSFPCPSARRRRPSAVRIARRGPQRHVPACTPPLPPSVGGLTVRLVGHAHRRLRRAAGPRYRRPWGEALPAAVGRVHPGGPGGAGGRGVARRRGLHVPGAGKHCGRPGLAGVWEGVRWRCMEGE